MGPQTLFIDYLVNSANENVINLEFNPAELHRALRSCASADEVVIRLTKRSSDHIPCLCLTINHGTSSVGLNTSNTLITQEVPIRILSLVTVAELHEPACPSPDVFLILPPLFQIRAMTDRFNRLATVSRTGAKAGVNEEPKLFLSASRDGTFSMKLEGSDMVEVETRWMGLEIPALNPLESSSRSESRRSTRRGRDQLAGVRVGGREWGKVLKVAAVAKKVTACFCEGHALVLFVHLTGEDEEYTANISV
ncbi:Checkpoint protein hus1 [Rhizina undulata]